ncbi:hypothetical protein HN51_014033 [Arachis hypogaea]
MQHYNLNSPSSFIESSLHVFKAVDAITTTPSPIDHIATLPQTPAHMILPLPLFDESDAEAFTGREQNQTKITQAIKFRLGGYDY